MKEERTSDKCSSDDSDLDDELLNGIEEIGTCNEALTPSDPSLTTRYEYGGLLTRSNLMLLSR